jgi:hypothetical protein
MEPKASKSLKIGFLSLIPFLLGLFSAQAEEKHSVSTALTGVKSQYSDRLTQLIKNWPTKRSALMGQQKAPIEFKCLETQGNDLYIGIEQVMNVSAPLDRVIKIVDDIDSYKDIFPQFKDVKIESKDSNLLVTFWEQIVPFPLVPNIKYRMLYLSNRVSPKRYVYRYQLKEPGEIKTSDGVIILEELGPASTRYTEYDFYDANWGIATVFGKNRIWHDNAEGMLLSDLAFRIKAENPSFSADKVVSETTTLLKRVDLDSCKAKLPAEQVF